MRHRTRSGTGHGAGAHGEAVQVLVVERVGVYQLTVGWCRLVAMPRGALAAPHTPSCSERSRCSSAADARACAATMSCTKALWGS